MKDNFSTQAAGYAKFRPSYPAEMLDHIVSLTPGRERAWDCATGNGQVAAMLSPCFDETFATDISERQLENAVQMPNVFYRKEVAENPSFPDGFFDLIVVAQAVHWFDFQRFNEQVRRVLKPNGIVAIIGYPLFKTQEPLNGVVRHFYENTIGKWWDAERKLIDEEYRTIPFPFEETALPRFEMKCRWTLEELTGFLNTWSAVQHCIRATGENPVAVLEEDLRKSWGAAEQVEIVFPLVSRVGRVCSITNLAKPRQRFVGGSISKKSQRCRNVPPSSPINGRF